MAAGGGRSRDEINAFGFWLPTGRNDFFHSTEDQALLDNPSLVRKPSDEGLQTSVFRRATSVFREFGYSYPQTIYPRGRHGASDPDAFVFRHTGDGWRALALVTAEGYYYWIAQGLEAADLADHVVTLLGGNFYSHFSGAMAERKYVGDLLQVGDTLLDYRDRPLGILTYAQLNTILEGLYNYNFDPRIFFRTEEDRDVELLDVKMQRSIGSFIRDIGSTFKGSNASAAFAREKAAARLKEDGATAWARKLFPPETQGEILEQFLRRTSLLSLDPLKQNVERCRRALLSEVLNVIHRRLPLVQAETPDDVGRSFHHVSEAQLRGYVMLVAAQLPIIVNTRRYIEDTFNHLTAESERTRVKARAGSKNRPGEDQWIELKLFRDSWVSLQRAIDEDVRELEDTVRQSTLDRQLYESERMRSEQETITELERLRGVRGRTAGGEGTSSILEVVFAAIGVLLASVGGSKIEGMQGVFIAAAVFLVFIVTPRLIRAQQRRRWERSPLDGRYIYETDARLDTPLSDRTVNHILEGLPLQHGRAPGFREDVLLEPISRRESSDHMLYRNSYRVERISADEAVHKIHFETFAAFPDARRRRSKLLLHVVYEIVFHRPAGYSLREVRVIATHDTRLTRVQLGGLQAMIIDFFINRFLDESHRLSHSGLRGDALVHLRVLNRQTSDALRGTSANR